MFRLRVREVAESKGFKVAALSLASDLNVQTIKNIYYSPIEEIRLSTLIKIAKALDVTLDDLVEILPESQPS
jgi:DNA-binding Xre family transcriptional regulator